ncbi:hypothetical protein [Pseudalkalibacillus caeni]|uniref:Uncharacterized protein n=1 Tax=Exobacillus caeni TaxID=2574798 RepID=A0A5R9F555_9BACL|nr:hypothetical protein [Pseudalkalibacillus caeni]TLS37609.1 hypothetical protein FCL54_10750 [Pseudalkalibacillus caeni]
MKFKSTEINISIMKVTAIDNISNLSFSSSQRVGVFSTVKKNQGFGIQSADRVLVFNPGYIVDDSDIDDHTTIR